MRSVWWPSNELAAGSTSSSRSSRVEVVGERVDAARARSRPRRSCSRPRAICSRWPARSIVADVMRVSVEVTVSVITAPPCTERIAFRAEIHGHGEGDMGAAIERSGSRSSRRRVGADSPSRRSSPPDSLVGGAELGAVATAAPPTHVSDCTGSASPARRWVSLLYIRALFRCDSGPDSEFGIRHFDPDAVRGSYSRAVYRSTEGSRKWVAQAFVLFLRRNPDPGEAPSGRATCTRGPATTRSSRRSSGRTSTSTTRARRTRTSSKPCTTTCSIGSAHTSETNFWLNRLAAGSTRTAVSRCHRSQPATATHDR